MIRGALNGAGYFSAYHLEAWSRIEQARIVAAVDADPGKARAAVAAHPTLGQPEVYDDVNRMLDEIEPDFVDIITPPASHHQLVLAAAERGIDVICQKPLAPTFEEATALVEAVERTDVRFMVHENFRWQPWYREVKRRIDEGLVGDPFHASFLMRTGDGWGADAYLARQPYFRSYPQLLFYETGVHFIDTFRYLFGEVETVFAQTARRNPVIAGEDAGIILLRFASGVTAVFDGSRYNELPADDPRFTFGSFRLDASSGHLDFDADGTMMWHGLGQSPGPVPYDLPRTGFAGDCVLALQQHFVDSVRHDRPFESDGRDYLRTVEVVEACYRSAAEGAVVRLDHHLDR